MKTFRLWINRGVLTILTLLVFRCSTEDVDKKSSLDIVSLESILVTNSDFAQFITSDKMNNQQIKRLDHRQQSALKSQLDAALLNPALDNAEKIDNILRTADIDANAINHLNKVIEFLDAAYLYNSDDLLSLIDKYEADEIRGGANSRTNIPMPSCYTMCAASAAAYGKQWEGRIW